MDEAWVLSAVPVALGCAAVVLTLVYMLFGKVALSGEKATSQWDPDAFLDIMRAARQRSCPSPISNSVGLRVQASECSIFKLPARLAKLLER